MEVSRPRLVVLALSVLAAAFAGSAPGALQPVAAHAAEGKVSKPPTPIGLARREAVAHRLDERTYRSWRRISKRAKAAVHRLDGARRTELAGAIRNVEQLAASGQLSRSRMPLAFLTLRRNLEAWTTRALPRPGDRLRFGNDQAVFQYYPGRGLQHHPLASAGRANALALPCLAYAGARDDVRVLRAERRGAARRAGAPAPKPSSTHMRRPRGPRCRPRSLEQAVDSLTSLASRRGDFTAWEYQFAYGGGSAPWISAMTQATAAQALARAGAALGRDRALATARSALGAFEQPPPTGIATGRGSGRHYLMYSFNSRLRILNGFLQSVIGLHDVAELTGSARARRLYRDGERAALAAVRGYDTGAWSLYASGGRESTLGYHRLVRGFLGGLCDRARRRAYCSAERRFALYEREPPRVHLTPLRSLREGRPATIAFSLSKLARVTVRVRGRFGRELRRTLSLSRGRHTLPWRPAGGGRWRLRIDAVGPSGPHAVVRETVRVEPKPKPKPKPKPEPKLGGEVRGDSAGGLGD